jgi:energy-coupling factor transport system ATP-binding protein
VLLKNGEVKWMMEAKSALRRVDELEASNIFPPQITIASHMLQKQNVIGQNVKLPITLEEGKKVFSNIQWNEENECIKKNNQKGENIVSFEKVSFKHRAIKGEPVDIMKELSLDIHKGEKIALIGSNGAGKSTLMKLMIGLLKPTEGEVFLMGKSVHSIQVEQISSMVSLVYQNPEQMFIKDSIRKDIEYAMKSRAVLCYKERTDELLEMFDLTDLADRDGRLLSGGQMRRASLAVGIALEPKILLLDEPTANLDIATRKEIMNTLTSLKDITETVVIATHDMQLVCDWADRIIVLYNGKIIADGTREEIFSNELIKSKVGIRAPEIVEMGQLLNMKKICFTINEFVSRFTPKQDKEIRLEMK